MNQALITLLSDGQFHSGEELGQKLGVSRAAIWKQLQKLEHLNIPLNTVKGRGYRLPDAVELIDAHRLAAHGLPAIFQDNLKIHLSLDSTNDELMRLAAEYPNRKAICFAEMQTAGRGRRGRQWQSPFAKNLSFSILWPFEQGIAAVQGLSLVIGLGIYRVLRRYQVDGLGLKWPNDILVNEAKLGGILIELTGAVSDACQVVIGVGLNLDLPIKEQARIDQPATGLKQLNCNHERNKLAAEIVSELSALLLQFEESGFEGFKTEWNDANGLKNSPVKLVLPSSEIVGNCDGVNNKGELVLSTESGVQLFNAGEVSLRVQERSK